MGIALITEVSGQDGNIQPIELHHLAGQSYVGARFDIPESTFQCGQSSLVNIGYSTNRRRPLASRRIALESNA